MYAGARRSVGPARVDDAAHRNAAARAAPAPVEYGGSTASRSAVSPGAGVRAGAGAATRGDELGAILARAVAERPHGGSGIAGPAGATLQRFLGFGKKKKPPRPTQALPAPPRPKQDLPAPARPKQALPPSAAASPIVSIPGVGQSLFEARQFDMGSDDMDLFEARQFDMGPAAPAFQPPPDVRPNAPADVAPSDDKFAPDLVPDETGLVPVAGNPYLEWLVSTFASDRGVMTPRSYGALRNLQVIASLTGAPPPRPIDRKYLAASSTAYDWGFAY